MNRVLCRRLDAPLRGVGAETKQATISPSTAGTGAIALGVAFGFLGPVAPLALAGTAGLIALGTGMHIGSWLEKQQKPTT